MNHVMIPLTERHLISLLHAAGLAEAMGDDEQQGFFENVDVTPGEFATAMNRLRQGRDKLRKSKPDRSTNALP